MIPNLGPIAFGLAFDRQRDRTRSYWDRRVGGIRNRLAWIVVSGFDRCDSTTFLHRRNLIGRQRDHFDRVDQLGDDCDRYDSLACATTLIVSLGLLATPLRIATIDGNVVILGLLRTGYFRRLGGGSPPLYGEKLIDA